MTSKRNQASTFRQRAYSHFDQINGRHPWSEAVPEGCLLYRVRELKKGEVLYFNFSLAKEMGLLPEDHPHTLNTLLRERLLKTFSIQIINEYDELNKRRFEEGTIKPNRYMATRYLQLQHHNKRGKTSGDGRGIWNGIVEHKGMLWDVSSRGTGVTSLAPGSVEANRPLQTGTEEYGYGCGLAEMDELLGAAIYAELMHLQGIPTERVLCVIDLGNGHGIGVRAAQNLLRPAHLFLYLKQGRLPELRRATSYLYLRQIQNKRWLAKAGENLYETSLREIATSFAKFTSRLEVNYIFAWLDWDGDNVLADAGIIDYGSIRQFGVRHDRYRYDDVQRYSTTLLQQKEKARQIVQVFAQLMDFAQTGVKKPLHFFRRHPAVKLYLKTYSQTKLDAFFYRLGFHEKQRKKILSRPKLAYEFLRLFEYLESMKFHPHYKKVADGINIIPLYNMRKLLFHWAHQPHFKRDLDTETLSYVLTQASRRGGKRRLSHHVRHFKRLQNLFQSILHVAIKKDPKHNQRRQVFARMAKLNSPKRITGNALIEIVDYIWHKQRSFSQEYIQALICEYGEFPEVPLPEPFKTELRRPRSVPPQMSQILKLIEANQEEI